MSIEVRPATRFGDVAVLLGPKRPDASVCWCLSHRLDAKTNRALVGRARGDYVESLCRREVAPGVLAYEDEEVVGNPSTTLGATAAEIASAIVPRVRAIGASSIGARSAGSSPTALASSVSAASTAAGASAAMNASASIGTRPPSER